MRITLEHDDLQAISDAVVRKLAPLILKVQEAAERAISAATKNVQLTETKASHDTKAAGEVIRRKELCQMTGLSLTTLWRQEREGLFPARIRLTNNRVGWRRREIEAWLAMRPSV